MASVVVCCLLYLHAAYSWNNLIYQSSVYIDLILTGIPATSSNLWISYGVSLWRMGQEFLDSMTIKRGQECPWHVLEENTCHILFCFKLFSFACQCHLTFIFELTWINVLTPRHHFANTHNVLLNVFTDIVGSALGVQLLKTSFICQII